MSFSLQDYKIAANKTKLDNIYEQTVSSYIVPQQDILFFNNNIKKTEISFLVHNKIYIILKKDLDIQKANNEYAHSIIKIVNHKLSSNYELIFTNKKKMLEIPEYKKVNKRKNVLLTCAIVLVLLIFIALIGSAIAFSI